MEILKHSVVEYVNLFPPKGALKGVRGTGIGIGHDGVHNAEGLTAYPQRNER